MKWNVKYSEMMPSIIAVDGTSLCILLISRPEIGHEVESIRMMLLKFRWKKEEGTNERLSGKVRHARQEVRSTE